MNITITWTQEIFLGEVTPLACHSIGRKVTHFPDEPQDVLKSVVVLKACYDAVPRAQPSHNEILWYLTH